MATPPQGGVYVGAPHLHAAVQPFAFKGEIMPEMKITLSDTWYVALVTDLRKLAFEGIVKVKWAIGRRILDDFEKFGKPEYGSKTVDKLAVDLKMGRGDLYRCIQFAGQIPELSSLDDNLSWEHIKRKLLPTPEEKPETPPLPEGKYRVIYADPPWEYGTAQHGKEEQATTLETHYPTMSDKALSALPIQSIGGDSSVLFLWATAPRIEAALALAHSWGFEYKAMFIWDKVKHNVGYYNSVRHELLLICTRGSCLPDTKELHDSVVSIPRSDKHSEKPEKFRSIIDTMYPEGPRIELFARQPAKGWAAWGNQI